LAERFATDGLFASLRLEPYFGATAIAHPDLAAQLGGVTERTAATRLALVHGDVSPKNLLVGPNGPVFLDAECAWFGDPAFDVAFCLTHLLLKCLLAPASSDALVESFDALFDEHRAHVDWEPPEVLEARVATLLPALLLARVDGKSPVEYLTVDSDRELVRGVSRELIVHPMMSVAEVRDAWKASLP
jgi:Ser/Thr protein kinase RdoA (MazF antagonist)